MTAINVDIQTVEYVEFLEPGSLFPEETIRKTQGKTPEQLARQAPGSCFAFTTYKVDSGEGEFEGRKLKVSSSRYDQSGRYYLGGELYDLDRLKGEFGEDPKEWDHRSLFLNLESNDRATHLIHCAMGNWQPFYPGDTLLPILSKRAAAWQAQQQQEQIENERIHSPEADADGVHAVR